MQLACVIKKTESEVKSESEHATSSQFLTEAAGRLDLDDVRLMESEYQNQSQLSGVNSRQAGAAVSSVSLESDTVSEICDVTLTLSVRQTSRGRQGRGGGKQLIRSVCHCVVSAV